MTETEPSGESLAGLPSQFVERLPQSIETAIVMVASCVEHETRDMKPDQMPSQIVERVVRDLTSQFQFVECGITQRQIRTMQQALVEYLDEHREP